MNKIKILFSITSFDGGGAERVFLHLLRNISRERFDVCLAVGLLDGVFIEDIPKDIHIYELAQSKSSRKSFFPLLTLIKKIEPDIVFSTLGLVVTASIVSFFTSKKIRFISRFGNTMSSYLEHIKRESYLKYYIQFFLNKLVCLRCEIIVQSDYMGIDLVKTLSVKKDNIIRIYNPIDFKLYNKKFNNTSLNDVTLPAIVSIGRLSWQKGYENLLKSFKLVLLKYPSATLVLIGHGELNQKLETLSFDLGIQKKVIFAGFHNDPFTLLDIDLFVSSSYYEGFSNAILEALAYGYPVVATDCPSGNRELIIEGKNGWLSSVEGNIVNNLADKIIYALEHLNTLDMNTAKKNIIEKFNIEKIIGEYEQLFEKRL